MTGKILHQIKDNFWEVRSRRGLLLAVICWDQQFGNYYVSAGDMDAEHFATFDEAARYAEVTL
jgi:hypothetical protein